MVLLETLEAELQRTGHTLLNCEQCGAPRRMVIDTCEGKVAGKSVKLGNLPLLQCDSCRQFALHAYARDLVMTAVEESHARSKIEMTLDLKTVCDDVNYAGYPEFQIDPTDYYFLPGLWRPNDSGFLTPVFFRKRVLHRYHSDDTYDLDYASNTYGTIGFPEGQTLEFGINRQDLVIMWLGDLARLPQDELSYLRSENVLSDHDIASDFYRGQIDCEFEYDSRERELMRFHTEFKKKIKQALSMRLSNYYSDINRALQDFKEPPLWSIKEVGHIWRSMNNVLVESLNNDGIKDTIHKYEPQVDLKNLRGLKLLEQLLLRACPTFNKNTLSPLFVLYDLRLVVSHSASDNLQKTFDSCYSRLGLAPASSSFKDLHHRLIDKLKDMYEQLIQSEFLPPPQVPSGD